MEITMLLNELKSEVNTEDGRLTELSKKVDVPAKTLRVFAAISDKENAHVFSAAAARKAFAGAHQRALDRGLKIDA